MTLKRLNPPDMPDAGAMGYSQITVCDPGQLVFMSGQVAWSADGSPPPEGLVEQAEIATANVLRGLGAVGCGPEDVTSIRLYLENPAPEDYNSVYPILMRALKGVKPTITALGVTSLGGTGLKVEIEVTARVPG